MNIDQLKNLLRHYGLKPNFTYGQNFLIDDIILQDIVDAAGVTKSDTVLEIGPGIGNLTRLLCERAGFLLSIEKDPKFQPILHSIKKDYRENFRFEIADALEFDFQSALLNTDLKTNEHGSKQHPIRVNLLQHPFSSVTYKVVANIPYYITGKILQMVLALRPKPESITLLTQKEVAQSIVAGPGKLSILAISVQLFGQPKIVQIVPSKSFYPAPKVDSAIIQIIPHKESPYKIFNEKNLFKIVKACFSGKRKQIHNTLKNNLHLTAEQVTEILSQLKIKPEARPQELTIEQWVELTKQIDKN